MLGVLANTAAVIAGALIGVLLNKGINKRIADGVMAAVGMCVIYIGITGAMNGKNTLVLVLSVAIGTFIGSAIDIDSKLSLFAKKVESKFKNKSSKTDEPVASTPIADAFVASTLLFCIGAMTVVGSLQAGLTGDNTTLFIKSILDFISAIVFTSTMGIGVIFSSIPVFILQGGIALVAHVISPLLTDAVIAEITCAGSVVIIALGLNLIGVTKFKIANFLPSIILPVALVPLYELISSAISAV